MKGSYFLHGYMIILLSSCKSLIIFAHIYICGRGTGRKTPVLLSFLGIILFSVVSASCTGHGEFQDKIGGTEHPCLHASLHLSVLFLLHVRKGRFLGWALSKRICQTFHV